MFIYGFAALGKYGDCVLVQDNNFDPTCIGQKPQKNWGFSIIALWPVENGPKKALKTKRPPRGSLKMIYLDTKS